MIKSHDQYGFYEAHLNSTYEGMVLEFCSLTRTRVAQFYQVARARSDIFEIVEIERILNTVTNDMYYLWKDSPYYDTCKLLISKMNAYNATLPRPS